MKHITLYLPICINLKIRTGKEEQGYKIVERFRIWGEYLYVHMYQQIFALQIPVGEKNRKGQQARMQFGLEHAYNHLRIYTCLCIIFFECKKAMALATSAAICTRSFQLISIEGFFK